ncbi:MAG: hypothetical protein AB7O52_06200 [Planctomycetota bacterium]
MGARGKGGARPPEAPPGETSEHAERLQGQRHQGKMIGSFLEQGMPPTGEARVELQNLIISGTRYAEQSLERERIPAELKEIPKQYFEKILPQ